MLKNEQLLRIYTELVDSFAFLLLLSFLKNWKTFFSFFTMKLTLFSFFTILNISCMYITNSIYAFNFSFMLKNVDEKFCNFMRHNKSNEMEMNSLPNVLCIVHEKAFFIRKQCLIDFLKWEILTEVFNFKVMRKEWVFYKMIFSCLDLVD